MPTPIASLHELPTPCIVIERRRLEANLVRMQTRAASHGAVLRPHTKTHKMVAIARRQQELGAQGLTVAKVGEAEVYAEAGFDDIFLAYPVVGPRKHERLAALSPQARITFGVDTLEAARRASAIYAEHGQRARVLIEIDTGGKRCGRRWNDATLPAFAQAVSALPGLAVAGIFTHEGHAYGGLIGEESQASALRRVMEEARDRMLRVAARLCGAGLPRKDFVISIGSTPSMTVFENREFEGFRITEIRPGNYVFHDRTQVTLGVTTLQECALTVLSTVVSKHRDTLGAERLFLDAGSKVLTSDRASGADGYGCLLYNAAAMVAHPHVRLVALSEEHGWARVRGGATYAVGDKARVVPNHACVVVNTQDEVFLVDGQQVVARWPVDARGCVR